MMVVLIEEGDNAEGSNDEAEDDNSYKDGQ